MKIRLYLWQFNRAIFEGVIARTFYSFLNILDFLIFNKISLFLYYFISFSLL